MATSRRILRKAGQKLREGGDCASFAGSIEGQRAAQKRKAARKETARRKSRT